MKEWNATHKIIHPLGIDLVMLVESVAYTEREWEGYDTADYEVVDGYWLFQGQPFQGEVIPLMK